METSFQNFLNEGSGYIGHTFYHGSNVSNIEKFTAFDSKFALLGTGIYAYKNKKSAESYGKYIYKISTIGLKIAPLDYKFDINSVEGFMHYLNLDEEFNKKKYPAGVFNPLWWATDGWDYYNLNRKDTVEKLRKIMTIPLCFDGYIVDYPNGGIVCIIWKYEKLAPI